MAKGTQYSVASETSARSDHRLGRVFAKLVGRLKQAKMDTGRTHALVLRDDFSRFTYPYLIRRKSEMNDFLLTLGVKLILNFCTKSQEGISLVIPSQLYM